MKAAWMLSVLLCLSMAATAQESHLHHHHDHSADSTDVFFRHLKLNELVVTGVTGDTKLKHSTAPITLLSGKQLRQTASTNIVDAIVHQPGMAQITTGGGIAKPVIRGLGYNRIIVMNDGVRQEGQQWGDEHGIEIDGQSVGSVEIIKGPASLMYGSDAMAGVLILKAAPTLAEGEIRADASTEFQTNQGLFGYSLRTAGNLRGFVWDARYSGKLAHAYHNAADGYVPGSQYREQALRLMVGLNRSWGHSHLIASLYHQQPSIIEGERDAETGQLLWTTTNRTTYSLTLPFQHIWHYKVVSDNSLNLPHGWLKAVVGYQQNRRQEYEESADDCEQYFRLHTLTYDVRYLTHETDGWKMAAGLNGMWQQSQNLADEHLIPAYRLLDIGGYATVSKSLKRWTLNGGLRLDHRRLSYHSRRFTGLTGSIGAVWNASDHLNLRLNVARGFRAPNMSELGADGVHEGTQRYELGNADLKAEYSWQADLGIDFTSRYVSAQLSLFANRIEHYTFAKRTDTEVVPGMLTYQYTQGDARLLGFEAAIDLHPIHSIHFENTFSYVDARQLHADASTRYLPLTPAPRWTSELKYELTHHGHALLDNAYLSLALECNLAQDHYYRADNTETRTPSYTLLSLSAGTDLNIRKRKVAELYLTVSNLLDRAYQPHLSRLKYTDRNSITGRQGVSNMGRNFVMKLVIPITL